MEEGVGLGLDALEPRLAPRAYDGVGLLEGGHPLRVLGFVNVARRHEQRAQAALGECVQVHLAPRDVLALAHLVRVRVRVKGER